jgi:DNA-binding IclR family transcriptional regulator
MSERKQHVKVEQAAYLALLVNYPEGGKLHAIAECLGVSTTTARRKLDGLKAQGKVTKDYGVDRWKLTEAHQPPRCPHCGGAL